MFASLPELNTAPLRRKTLHLTHIWRGFLSLLSAEGTLKHSLDTRTVVLLPATQNSKFWLMVVSVFPSAELDRFTNFYRLFFNFQIWLKAETIPYESVKTTQRITCSICSVATGICCASSVLSHHVYVKLHNIRSFFFSCVSCCLVVPIWFFIIHTVGLMPVWKAALT